MLQKIVNNLVVFSTERRFFARNHSCLYHLSLTEQLYTFIQAIEMIQSQSLMFQTGMDFSINFNLIDSIGEIMDEISSDLRFRVEGFVETYK